MNGEKQKGSQDVHGFNLDAFVVFRMAQTKPNLTSGVRPGPVWIGLRCWTLPQFPTRGWELWVNPTLYWKKAYCVLHLLYGYNEAQILWE